MTATYRNKKGQPTCDRSSIGRLDEETGKLIPNRNYYETYLNKPVPPKKAKAEKYAKIISKTIILSGMDTANFGQNAYFYDAAEALLTATILLVAEFCEPQKRHCPD